MPNEPPPSLRDVVEAALHVTILDTPDGREAVLMGLRPELVSNISRMSSARLDIMSIVDACDRYKGLVELVRAIRLQAGDTTAVGDLDAVTARYLREPR